MKQIQKTTLAGAGGLAVSVEMMRIAFQDVPIIELVDYVKMLTTNQVLNIIIPLILGTLGICFDEKK